MKRLSVVIVCALALVPGRAQARGQSWTEVFADASAPTVFFGADGSLFLAPFNLATRQVLWAPVNGQHVVRVRVSPDGARVAWLTRGFDEDTTRLWIHDSSGTVLRARYFAFAPRLYGYTHNEPDVPTVEDPGAGARLVQASALMRHDRVNTLEWTANSHSVIVGHAGGIAAMPHPGGTGLGVTHMAAVEMETLHPSEMLVVDAINLEPPGEHPELTQFDLEHITSDPSIRVKDGRKISTTRVHNLLHLETWQLCVKSEVATSRRRTASPNTVWWAEDNTVRAIRSGDCEPTEKVRAADRIVWLGYDAPRRSLMWAAGDRLWALSDSATAPFAKVLTGSAIQSVLPAASGSSLALVTRDSLVVWDPATSASHAFRLADLTPGALFVAPDGHPIVSVEGGAGDTRRLAEGDLATHALEEIATPKVWGGTFWATPGGDWILLYDPAGKAKPTLQVYDVRRRSWRTVDNPGITGWEPMAPERRW